MSVTSGRSLSPSETPGVHNISSIVIKLLLAVPAFCQYTGVQVTDIKSLQQWKDCGYQGLLRHNLAKPDGPYKEMYNVIGQWLRLLATAHQEDGPVVTALQQKWLNMFGRWPITIAFFVSSAPSASQPLLPPGREPEGNEVPNGLRGEVFDAAMSFKRYLTDDARDPATAIIPMVPVLWEDTFSLRLALGNILRTQPPLSPGLLRHASFLERGGSTSTSSPLHIHAVSREMAGLTIQSALETHPKDRSSSTTPRAGNGRNDTSSDSGDSQ